MELQIIAINSSLHHARPLRQISHAQQGYIMAYRESGPREGATIYKIILL